MRRSSELRLTPPELVVGDYIKSPDADTTDYYPSKHIKGYWLEITNITHARIDDTYTIKARTIAHIGSVSPTTNKFITKRYEKSNLIQVLFREIKSTYEINREGTGYVYHLTGDKEGDYNAYYRLRLYKHSRKLDNDITINLTELYLVRYDTESVKKDYLDDTILKEAAMYEVEFEYHEPWDINNIKLIGKIKSNE